MSSSSITTAEQTNINTLMIDFFQAVFEHAFLRNALIAGFLASIACGVIGTYVVTRRITLIGKLDDEQRQRLLEIADRCPVHRTLESDPQIVTELAD